MWFGACSKISMPLLDMKELEHCVRSIEADGLDWKACKTFYVTIILIFFLLLFS